MNRHKEGIDEAYEILSVATIERQDVEDAIRAYHEKTFKRVDNAPVDGLLATKERYVGPWEDVKR